MAAPFYSQADQAIYQSGDKFIPQEQYRLNYAPPAIMGQNTNAGIAGTQAAGSYMGYPSYEAWLLAQGGGGGGGDGGGGGSNISTWSPNQNLGPTNITDYEAEAAGKGSTWRGSLARVQDAFSNIPLPSNLLRKGIRRWRENRDVRREQNLQEEIRADNLKAAAAAQQATKTASGVGPTTGQGGAIDRGDVRDIGGGFHEYKDSGTAAGYEGSFKKGGRIGYQGGEFVDEDINIQGPGFDVNENVEMAEANPFQMRIQELMSKGLSWEDAYDIAAQEFQDEFAERPEESFSQEGIASLV